ncbi:carbohydrate ABC transporter permease [Halopenitus persicus]|uniref:carbohydrate ABC transporter permease n=1 Tax=Halopenitus persicus TaxID=1048396 RepID=UPI000BBAB8C3|nr:carbohydrate ABC transporter permease [Halopenitus persicus]
MSITNKIQKVSNSSALFEFVKWALIACMMAIFALPMMFAFFAAFRPPNEFYASTVRIIPEEPTLSTWVDAFVSLQDQLVNSFIIATGTTIMSMVIVIPAAYVFARKQFPGKITLFYLIIAAMMFPYVLLIIPIASIWDGLGLYNSIVGLWIGYQIFVTPFAIWILRDYFAKLPTNLEESAQMYGCTQASAFLRVVLPLSAPAVVAVGFLSFLTAWNDFLMSNMLTTGVGPRPAVVQLYIITTGEVKHWGLVMAMTFIIGFPPTVLYLLGRRQLSQSFSVG